MMFDVRCSEVCVCASASAIACMYVCILSLFNHFMQLSYTTQLVYLAIDPLEKARRQRA